MARKILSIEGWRFICHSYAIFNQWQLLYLHHRGDVELRFTDVPFAHGSWAPLEGLFSESDMRILKQLAPLAADEQPDATLRVAFPYNFRRSHCDRSLVFGTSEFQIVPPDHFVGIERLSDLVRRPDVTVITPSNWSATGFRSAGVPDRQIVTIPHGVDTTLFTPAGEGRQTLRRNLGLSGFVFFANAGSLTWNKNIELVLKAFSTVAQERKDARLLIKGADSLYASSRMLNDALNSLSHREVEIVREKAIYHGQPLSMSSMVSLYQASDAYVSPYRAEGFNMPVLEATACGLPVICTGGGSTDDFVAEDFARKVNAKLKHIETQDGTGNYLDADLDHLIHLMLEVMDDEAWRRSAVGAGPAHAGRSFTWDSVVDRLVKTAFPA